MAAISELSMFQATAIKLS